MILVPAASSYVTCVMLTQLGISEALACISTIIAAESSLVHFRVDGLSTVCLFDSSITRRHGPCDVTQARTAGGILCYMDM